MRASTARALAGEEKERADEELRRLLGKPHKERKGKGDGDGGLDDETASTGSGGTIETFGSPEQSTGTLAQHHMHG